MSKESFQTRKRELAIIVAAPITLLPSVLMRIRRITIRGTTLKKASMNIRRKVSNWEKHTLAIQGSSSTPKLFSNMVDDDGHISSHICLMAKGEKVKTKSKSSRIPSDISSSELSESSSDDDLSDNDEFVQITRKLDPKTKIFITKLLEDLESV